MKIFVDELPTSCFSEDADFFCPLFNACFVRGRSKIKTSERRPDDCPLVVLPERQDDRTVRSYI